MAHQPAFDLIVRNRTRAPIPATWNGLAVRMFRAALPYMKGMRGMTVEAAVVFVGSRGIRALNRKWRKKDAATDVLAFPLLSATPKGYTRILLGDVFVCPEVVRAKAAALGHTFRYQLRWTLAHGFLHLAGYDHERSKRHADRMAEVEQRILKGIR